MVRLFFSKTKLIHILGKLWNYMIPVKIRQSKHAMISSAMCRARQKSYAFSTGTDVLAWLARMAHHHAYTFQSQRNHCVYLYSEHVSVIHSEHVSAYAESLRFLTCSAHSARYHSMFRTSGQNSTNSAISIKNV
jgi:DNA-directed RNA polymerase specialized sigma24 family protein